MSSSVLVACAAGAAALAGLLFHRHETRLALQVRLGLRNLQALTERCVKVLGYHDEEVGLITDILLFAQVRMRCNVRTPPPL